MTTRAQRRMMKDRKKRRARALYPRCAHPEKYADNLTPCSCYGCGNPRRHFKGAEKITMRERRMREAA